MKELIDHILYVAHQNELKITHLQLHKVAYFTLGYIIQQEYEVLAKKLYSTDDKFEPWKYGPVLRETYKNYKKYNSFPILDNGTKSKKINEIDSINNIIVNLINHNVFDLVNVSHNHKFWKSNNKTFINGKKTYYSFDILRSEFKK